MANERKPALKERILIVDDTPDDLQVLSTSLTRHGYRVHCVSEGGAALHEVLNFQPELVLLDILMPEVNGYEVCQQLKADLQTEAIPVIFLSALDDVLDKVKAFEMGGVDYITKPFQIKEVLARVENQLTIKQLQRSLREQNEQLRLAEEALREQKQYLRLVIDNIPQQVFWKDTNLVFRGCNKNWAEAAGFNDPETVVGKTDYDLVLDRHVAEAFRATDQQVLQTNTPMLHVVATKQNPGLDGTVVWLDVNKLPIHDTEGHLIGVLGVLEDITDRRQAEVDLKREQEKSERLLLNILPSAIAQRLKENQGSIADAFEEVTVLFADIVGFTQLASTISPREVVGLLNRIFSLFDRLCDRHGLEKIKTVGDAYMVVGGLPNPKTDHAVAIAQMALDMQREISQFNTRDNQGIVLRIGINTGPVVAGVIGTKRFSYDLWGDTVNVASRMESQGEGGKIQVTPSTYDRLHQHFALERRGNIFVKGRGEMTTYWLQDSL